MTRQTPNRNDAGKGGAPRAIDRAHRLFLLMMSVCLFPVALSYGVMPEHGLPLLYDISDPDLPTRHIFRAVMGLYLGMIGLWLAGALRPELRIAALWTVLFFVTGIALGRVLSLVLDGWPGPLLVFYLVAEIVLAATTLWLLFRARDQQGEAGA